MEKHCVDPPVDHVKDRAAGESEFGAKAWEAFRPAKLTVACLAASNPGLFHFSFTAMEICDLLAG
jgi:hypothetical protein